MKAVPRAFLLISALLPLQHGLAADWQLVLSDRNRRIEIDRGSIFSSDPGIRVAWGRVVLGQGEALVQGYATIKALNRYDCQQRSFQTVKRVYIDDGEHLVREEVVEDSLPLRVTPNSVDERMWREVCRPGSKEEMRRLAGEVNQQLAQIGKSAAAASAQAKPASAPSRPAQAGQARPLPVQAGDEPGQGVQLRKVALDNAGYAGQAVRASAPAQASVPAPQAKAGKGTAGAATTLKANAVAPEAGAGRKTPPAPGPQPLPGKGAGEHAQAVATAGKDREDPLGQWLATAVPASAKKPAVAQWAYQGGRGPQAWGDLHPEWRLCSQGLRQAPANLEGSLAVDLPPLKLHYQRSGFRIRDLGHGLEVGVGGGMGMEVRGVRYELESFSLHRPAQAAGGSAGDMVAYFSHRSADGHRAMLAVPLRAGGADNPLLDTLLAHLPLERGEDYVPAATLDLGSFMPAQSGYFVYQGSLPEPPCTEGVLWVVLKAPVQMSAGQLALFSRLHAPNVRPLQPAHDRIILESR